MKRMYLVYVCVGLLLLGIPAAGAWASYDVTMYSTADNIVDTITVEQSGASNTTTVNYNNWQHAYPLDLNTVLNTFDPTKNFAITWKCENVGDYNSGNPAALLAQINLGATTLYSGVNTANVLWQVSTDGKNWATATPYGNNGGGNIWGNNLNGPVAGISGSAQWIWDDKNFAAGKDQTLLVRVEAVPIPGAFWLLGSGLAGMIGIRRKYFG